MTIARTSATSAAIQSFLLFLFTVSLCSLGLQFGRKYSPGLAKSQDFQAPFRWRSQKIAPPMTAASSEPKPK
jgi:hypothetical protein